MTRLATVAVALAGIYSAEAFTVARSPLAQPSTSLFMSDDEPAPVQVAERGVSVDQDGKSNVWAIEPKVEVESKSTEEKTSSALFAAGGFAAFSVVAAGLLTNLPDPNNF